MANKVEQIVTAIEAQIATTLSEYTALNYVNDIEKNSFVGNKKKYGVKPLGLDRAAGVTRSHTVDQIFQVILTDDYTNSPANDESARSKIYSLFDKMNDLEKQFFKSKIGLTSIVLFMNLTSIEDPEVLEENKVIALRGNFLVKYRTNIDS